MKIETVDEDRKSELDGGSARKAASKRALVVDDDPGVSLLIQEVLGSVDIDASAPVQGQQVGQSIEQQKFDVVLIGMQGTGEEGCEIAQKVRQSGLNRSTPIIMISGDQSPSALRRGFDAGATFFAYKPIDRAHLMRLIRVSQGAIEHEKRRFRRVPLKVKVRIKSAELEIFGETVDISLNGALVKVPQTIPVGSLVEIGLHLFAGAEPIVGLGTVVRVLQDNHLGLLLDRLSNSEIGRLQEYLLPRIYDLLPEKKDILKT